MSSSSILGLVNQLHSMESSFTEILMEATMKLSSLTDASVFLLLETQEGRRYCGKRHLCDAYKTQGLCPIGNDVEMELVPGVAALQVRRSDAGVHEATFASLAGPLNPNIGAGASNNPVINHSNNHFVGGTGFLTGTQILGRKRPHDASPFNQISSPRKQFRSSADLGVAMPPYVAKSAHEVTMTNVTMGTGIDVASAIDDGEVVTVDVKKEDEEKRQRSGFEEEVYLDERTGDKVHRRNNQSSSHGFSPGVSSASGFNTKTDAFLDSFTRKAAVEQLSLEQKLEILKGLEPEALTRPGAVDTEEYLVFQKICYEFCRACALECPVEEEDVDAFFDSNFNRFVTTFPKLNTSVDVLYLMRLLTKRSYKQYLKTRGKRKNDHSKMSSFFT